MEQKSISNSTVNEKVKILKAEIESLDYQKKRLMIQLKEIQNSCKHDFMETAIMRKCRKCMWAESIYY